MRNADDGIVSLVVASRKGGSWTLLPNSLHSFALSAAANPQYTTHNFVNIPALHLVPSVTRDDPKRPQDAALVPTDSGDDIAHAQC